MRIIIVIVCMVGGFFSMSGQQQVLYTQFMFNKQGINAAFAGQDEVANITGIYRAQWIGLEGAPTIQYLSASIPIQNKNIGLGINLNHHSIGITNSTHIDLLYAYKVETRYGVASGGLQTSLQHLSQNFGDSRLITLSGVDGDPAVTSDVQSKNVFNTGIGFYFHAEQFYAGFSIPQILNSNLDDDRYLQDGTSARHYYMMGGYELQLWDEVSLMTQALIRYTRRAPIDVDLNVYCTYMDRYNVGLSYRTGGDTGSIGESIDVLLGMSINENIYIGLSYDITLSTLRNYQSGSVELLGHYRIGSFKNVEDFINPRFF